MAFEIDYFGQRGTLGRGANLATALLKAQARAASAEAAQDHLIIKRAKAGDHDLTPPGDTSPQRLTVFDDHRALFTEAKVTTGDSGTIRASVHPVWLGATGMSEQIIARPLILSAAGPSQQTMFYYRVRYVQ